MTTNPDSESALVVDAEAIYPRPWHLHVMFDHYVTVYDANKNTVIGQRVHASKVPIWKIMVAAYNAYYPHPVDEAEEISDGPDWIIRECCIHRVMSWGYIRDQAESDFLANSESRSKHYKWDKSDAYVAAALATTRERARCAKEIAGLKAEVERLRTENDRLNMKLDAHGLEDDQEVTTNDH